MHHPRERLDRTKLPSRQAAVIPDHGAQRLVPFDDADERVPHPIGTHAAGDFKQPQGLRREVVVVELIVQP